MHVFRQNKGCSAIRQVEWKYQRLKDDPSPVIDKWHRRLNTVITEEGWKKIFVLHRRSGLEAKFQWFQVRLVQNILGTNKRMHTIRPADHPSPLCTFCSQEPETVIHLFHDCPFSIKIWDELGSWLCDLSGEEIIVTRLMRLFGATFKSPNDPINICLLVTRFFIWYCRCSTVVPNFPALTNYIQFYLRALKMSYRIKGKGDQFDNIWSKFMSWIG